MSDETPSQEVRVFDMPTPPYQLSIVDKNGVVQENFWTQERMAALLLSGCTVVYSEGGLPHVCQSTYDVETNTFKQPGGSTYTPAKFELGK